MYDDKDESKDEEPTYWCRRCLSLRIMAAPGCGDYCDSCGDCDVARGTWEEYEAAVSRRAAAKARGRASE